MNCRKLGATAAAALLLAAALVIELPGGALGGTARSATNSQTFPDSTGENPAAPDITSIAVSNDDAGNITFQINVSNRPVLTSDMLFLIFLDTDGNPSTGDPQGDGADYAIQLVSGAVDLFQWSNNDYVPAPSQSSKALSFSVFAASGITVDSSGNPDFSNSAADFAPDAGHGTYSYKVLTKLTLSVVVFTTTPKPARAGKLFAAGLAVTESDTGGPVKSGTVTCAATVGGKQLAAAAHAVANGIALCAWRLPKTAKGKTIRGTVTLVVQGVKAAKSFSVKVT